MNIGDTVLVTDVALQDDNGEFGEITGVIVDIIPEADGGPPLYIVRTFISSNHVTPYTEED